MDISEVNQLNEKEFIDIFGNIVECYSKTAEYLYLKKPYEDEKRFLEIVFDFLGQLPLSEKEKILQLHPDLAGKLADEGQLTHESTQEQKAAGLDKITVEEKLTLNDLNWRYKAKFGFPFVICARENKAESILNGLKKRLNNERPQELNTGIEEVKKICMLRLKDIMKL